MYLYRMFYKIFVVGYDDDGRMVVFNDLANDEEETHNTMFSKTREFHKISIVLFKLVDHSHHHHLSLLSIIYTAFTLRSFTFRTIMMMAMIKIGV